MSERREFNGPSVEEALEKAAMVLEVQRESLSYEIIDEGSSGFLGLGVRDARIMVETISVTEKADTEPAADEVPESSILAEDHPSEWNDLGDAAEESGDSQAEPEPEEVSEAFLEEVRSQIETTLDAMAFDSEVRARDAGEVVVADIESEDAGLLIGPKGETLDAVQYLVNVAIYRKHSYAKKVVLDCGGYRERRIKAVQGMAHRTAKRVLREGKQVDLPPMSSSERKAVHSYLKNYPELRTRSEGEDESRHVTVAPSR